MPRLNFARHGGRPTRTKSKVSQRPLLRNCEFYGRQQLPSALKAKKRPEATETSGRNYVRIRASMEPSECLSWPARIRCR